MEGGPQQPWAETWPVGFSFPMLFPPHPTPLNLEGAEARGRLRNPAEDLAEGGWKQMVHEVPAASACALGPPGSSIRRKKFRES